MRRPDRKMKAITSCCITAGSVAQTPCSTHAIHRIIQYRYVFPPFPFSIKLTTIMMPTMNQQRKGLVLLLLTVPSSSLQAAAFLPSYFGSRSIERRARNPSSSSIKNGDTSAGGGGVADADFDFSSQQGWNDFYDDDTTADITEWHRSVPLQVLIDAYIPLGSSCLVVGCGNSQLPRAIYDAHSHQQQQLPNEKSSTMSTKITCLDSSSTCLEQLRRQFDDTNAVKDGIVSFVCGDAVKLTETLLQANGDTSANIPDSFDVIIDKGLSDAILCGEGWNGPLEHLMHESIKVLSRTNNNSSKHQQHQTPATYLLVSYKLPKSTQQFLQQVSIPHVEWSFGRPEGTGKVQVSLATMV